MRFAHPTGLSRYPLPKSLPSGEGLAFTASSEEEWCFANAKPKFSIKIKNSHFVVFFQSVRIAGALFRQNQRLL